MKLSKFGVPNLELSRFGNSPCKTYLSLITPRLLDFLSFFLGITIRVYSGNWLTRADVWPLEILAGWYSQKEAHNI